MPPFLPKSPLESYVQPPHQIQETSLNHCAPWLLSSLFSPLPSGTTTLAIMKFCFGHRLVLHDLQSPQRPSSWHYDLAQQSCFYVSTHPKIDHLVQLFSNYSEILISLVLIKSIACFVYLISFALSHLFCSLYLSLIAMH